MAEEDTENIQNHNSILEYMNTPENIPDVIDHKKTIISPELSVELKSDEVTEMLGKSPNWIISSGILMIAIVTFLLLIGSYIIKYPDIVTTEVNIATKILPASVIAKFNGKITNLMIKENDSVSKGTYLGLIENPASYNDIMLVKKWFEPFYKKFMEQKKVDTINFDNKILKLGDIQSTFFDLNRNIKKHQFYFDQDAVQKKIGQLEKKIKQQQDQLKRLKKKHKLKRIAFAISKRKYKVDKKLFKQKAITEQEYNDASTAYLNSRMEINSLAEEESSSKLQLEELKFQVTELLDQGEEKKVQLINEISAASLSLEGALKKWEENYVLVAPISGKVSFYKFWTTNQEVKSGDEVMVVIPESEKLFAYSYLEAANSGKIKINQKVRIELEDYPYEQYGSVFGTVAYKSDISRDGKYFIKIDLPNGLKSKNGHELKFSQEMKGNANIITEELRLLERLSYKYLNDFDKFL